MRPGERPPVVARLERRMLPLARSADLAFWMRLDLVEVRKELRLAVEFALSEPFEGEE